MLIQEREAAAALARELDPVSFMATAHHAVATCVARHLDGAAALLGDREAARRHYEQALAVAEKVGFRPEIALTRLALAELALTGDGPLPPTPSPATRERGALCNRVWL